MISSTRLNNIRIEYINLLKNIKSFPEGPLKRKARDELHSYMKSVRDRFGQEVVDKVTKKT